MGVHLVQRINDSTLLRDWGTTHSEREEWSAVDVLHDEPVRCLTLSHIANAVTKLMEKKRGSDCALVRYDFDDVVIHHRCSPIPQEDVKGRGP